MLTYISRRWTFKFKCTSPWESIWFWVSFFTKNDYKKLGYIFKSVLFNRLIVDYKVSLSYTSLILVEPLLQGIVFNRWEFGLQFFLFFALCSVIILIIPSLEVIVLNRDGTLDYEVLLSHQAGVWTDVVLPDRDLGTKGLDKGLSLFSSSSSSPWKRSSPTQSSW